MCDQVFAKLGHTHAMLSSFFSLFRTAKLEVFKLSLFAELTSSMLFHIAEAKAVPK